jgi:signal transduction histidine kinase/CheY-like chemotaxis protein
MFDTAILKSVFPGWPKMSPLTASTFLLAGLTLWFVTADSSGPLGLNEKRKSGYRFLSQIGAALVTTIGLIRLGDYLMGWNLGLGQLWFQESASDVTTPAQVSPATAFIFILLGGALFLANSLRFVGVFQFLTLLGGLLGWMKLSRYLYGGEPLIPFAQMAIHTSGVFFILSAGILCSRTDGGLIALLVSDSAGGVMIRRLLPPALIVPIVFGWLCLQGQRAGWFGAEAGLSLFALSNVIVFGALAWINAAMLHHSDTERKKADRKIQAHLERLNLLHQITRAIGERQDLHSIFQVVIRSLEDSLPIDFGCIGLYDETANVLKVVRVGVKSEPTAMELAMGEQAVIPIDENGLSRCLLGQLVYEPDISQAQFPFPQRLARGGLCSLVIAPLLVESKVFGVLVAARRQPQGFVSGECEFLKQLSEHVALASHQSQLHSALQQAYDDLRQTQEAVMQQERLRALGQMASGIAHDINNAIAPAGLYTESLLESEPNLSPRARNYLETIGRAIGDVAQTVARMGEFYRQREPQLTLTQVNLNQLVQQVIDLSRARWNDAPQQRGIVIQMRTELSPDLPAIMGAESEIREALINLIFNGVDAMPEGGTLTLRTKVVEAAPASPGSPPIRLASVEVADTGVGMDEGTRRRCLEPFFTTKGERGTGLGLAMVFGMVKRHSAEFEIESVVGKGTTARMSFTVPTTTIAEAAASARAHAIPSRLRILVVDDDPLLIKSLRDALETDGHVVVTANGGQAGIDAFQIASGSDKPFDVVITDLGMPHVDGRKVATAVKNASPATPVIMLTGWGQRIVSEKDVPSHVDHVLNKPPKLHELRLALAEVITPK